MLRSLPLKLRARAPRYAALYYDTLRHAMAHARAAFCSAALCRALPRSAALCCALPRSAAPCCAVLYRAAPR
eukprot:10183048-Lingulodinium_polyedra.AAC.1